jgi:hypothetical protein
LAENCLKISGAVALAGSAAVEFCNAVARKKFNTAMEKICFIARGKSTAISKSNGG